MARAVFDLVFVVVAAVATALTPAAFVAVATAILLGLIALEPRLRRT